VVPHRERSRPRVEYLTKRARRVLSPVLTTRRHARRVGCSDRARHRSRQRAVPQASRRQAPGPPAGDRGRRPTGERARPRAPPHRRDPVARRPGVDLLRAPPARPSRREDHERRLWPPRPGGPSPGGRRVAASWREGLDEGSSVLPAVPRASSEGRAWARFPVMTVFSGQWPARHAWALHHAPSRREGQLPRIVTRAEHDLALAAVIALGNCRSTGTVGACRR